MPKARPWPDYCSKQTLADRLDIEPEYLDQLEKRGVLPPPRDLGGIPRWRWSDVDEVLNGGIGHEKLDDPFLAGVERVASQKARDSAAAGREQGPCEGEDVSLPRQRPRHRKRDETDSFA
jgi:hypothetical protein